MRYKLDNDGTPEITRLDRLGIYREGLMLFINNTDDEAVRAAATAFVVKIEQAIEWEQVEFRSRVRDAADRKRVAERLDRLRAELARNEEADFERKCAVEQ